MKYIRKYESALKSLWTFYSKIWADVLPFKYILYKEGNSIYFILEIDYNGVDNILNDLENLSNNYTSLPWLPTKRLFIFNKETNILKKKDKSIFNLGCDNIEKIFYLSNDLNEVKSFLPTFNDMDKFNM